MNIQILNASMNHSKESGYIGHVQFEVENHKKPYEITLQSNKGKNDWSYAINFSSEPGSEEEIQALDEQLEEDDELFEQLVNAVMNTME